MSVYYDLNNSGSTVQSILNKANHLIVTGSGDKYLADDGEYRKINIVQGGGTQFTIAPSNAVNKEKADLILTGTGDAQAINDAFTMLANARANSSVAVRVDFLGGDIDTKVDEEIYIPQNFYVYGNGVRIYSSVDDWNATHYVVSAAEGTHLYDMNIGGGGTALSTYGGGAVLYDCIIGGGNEQILQGSFTLINCTLNFGSSYTAINGYLYKAINCTFKNGTGYDPSVQVASRGVIIGCTFESFDGAPAIKNTADYVIITNNHFKGNYANIEDTGTGTVIANNVEED